MDDNDLIGKIVDIPDKKYKGWKGRVIGFAYGGTKVVVAPLKDPKDPESYIIIDGELISVMFLRIRVDPDYRKN